MAELRELSMENSTGKINCYKLEVDIFPGKLCEVKIPLTEGESSVCVGVVKAIITTLLKISEAYAHYFGLFSGTLKCPGRLYFDDSELLPVDSGHYCFMRLHFLFCEDECSLQQDKSAEFLVFSEMIYQYRNHYILPIPLGEVFESLKSTIVSSDVTGFWSTLNKFSRCIDSQGDAIWYQGCTTDEGFGLIRLAMDLSGIHFFCENRMTLVSSWLWNAVTNLRLQIEPTTIFKFDIVIKENSKYLLRTISVHTSAGEYIYSVAHCILLLHSKHISSGRNKPLLYQKHFKAKEIENKPYEFNAYPEMPLFESYVKDAELDNENFQAKMFISNIAYDRPSGFYTNKAITKVPYPFKVDIHTYNIYYFSRKSVNSSGCYPNHMEDYVTSVVGISPGGQVKAGELLRGAVRSLRLRESSMKHFALYTMKDGCRVQLLCNDNYVIISDDLKLCIRSLVFFWSNALHRSQWEALKKDERATKLLFWEVMAAHGSSIRCTDLILNTFAHTCQLLEITFALGSIADIHNAIDCILVNKLTNIPNDGYLPGRRVILSLDVEGVHFWSHENGHKIVSWNWTQVHGLHKCKEPKWGLTFRILVAPSFSNDYREVTVETCSVSYLFSMSYIYMANFGHRQKCFLKWVRDVKAAGFEVTNIKSTEDYSVAGKQVCEATQFCKENYKSISSTKKGKLDKATCVKRTEELPETCDLVKVTSKDNNTTASRGKDMIALRDDQPPSKNGNSTLVRNKLLSEDTKYTCHETSKPLVKKTRSVQAKHPVNEQLVSVNTDISSAERKPVPVVTKTVVPVTQTIIVGRTLVDRQAMFYNAGIFLNPQGVLSVIDHEENLLDSIIAMEKIKYSISQGTKIENLLNSNPIVTPVSLLDCVTACRSIISFYGRPMCAQNEQPPDYLKIVLEWLKLISPTGNGQYFFNFLHKVPH